LQKQGITTNRTIRKDRFEKEGLKLCGELALANLTDLVKILSWNNENNIKCFRLSSTIFPWSSQYNIEDLPNYNCIKEQLIFIGKFIQIHDIRVSFHPDHFCVLGSDREKIALKAAKDINFHSQLFDLMGLEQSHKYPINIHVGTTKGGKEKAALRFCIAYELYLSEGAKKRFVVENDDHPTEFTPEDLYNMIWRKIQIPITFDYYHNKLNPGKLNEMSAFKLCYMTWKNVKPLFHYSSSMREEYKDNAIKITAHSNYILEEINIYLDVDIDLEAKMKEQAVLRYLNTFNK
jgi:UV DNA damage endonuclease